MVLESQTGEFVLLNLNLSGISKSQMWVFVFYKGQRKKESVVSELACGRVSKFLLVSSNRILLV